MAKILQSKSIYYNDVNLIAQPSLLSSRSLVPKELNRIMVSPMEAVVGKTFAKEAVNLGLSVCLHRFCDVTEQLDIYYDLSNNDNVFVSVGANDWSRVDRLARSGVKNFIIDIANGYIPNLKEVVVELKKRTSVKKIMLGNIMTGLGFLNLVDPGFDTYVRVGIAGGSACATSDATGYNRGQITELIEVNQAKLSIGIAGEDQFIVADGGIKNGNYAAKAFGAGADFVLMGGYFSKAIEAETHIIGDGTYWGGASHKQQERYGGIKKHSEGKVYKIEEELKPLRVLVDELWGGISSAISYSGHRTLTDFVGKGVFEIKENSLPPKR